MARDQGSSQERPNHLARSLDGLHDFSVMLSHHGDSYFLFGFQRRRGLIPSFSSARSLAQENQWINGEWS